MSLSSTSSSSVYYFLVLKISLYFTSTSPLLHLHLLWSNHLSFTLFLPPAHFSSLLPFAITSPSWFCFHLSFFSLHFFSILPLLYSYTFCLPSFLLFFPFLTCCITCFFFFHVSVLFCLSHLSVFSSIPLYTYDWLCSLHYTQINKDNRASTLNSLLMVHSG